MEVCLRALELAGFCESGWSRWIVFETLPFPQEEAHAV